MVRRAMKDRWREERDKKAQCFTERESFTNRTFEQRPVGRKSD